MSAASTGLPAASASRAGSPKPSSIEGSTSARAPATSVPQLCRPSASPSRARPAPSARSTSRPAGPASTRSGWTGPGPAARHGPRRSRCRFLRGSREPTKTRYSSGRPRAPEPRRRRRRRVEPGRVHAEVRDAHLGRGQPVLLRAPPPRRPRSASARARRGPGPGARASRYSRLASLTVSACSSYVRSCTVTTSRAWRVGGETKLVPWNTSVVPTRSSTGGQEPRRHSDRTSRAGTRRPTWRDRRRQVRGRPHRGPSTSRPRTLGGDAAALERVGQGRHQVLDVSADAGADSDERGRVQGDPHVAHGATAGPERRPLPCRSRRTSGYDRAEPPDPVVPLRSDGAPRRECLRPRVDRS